MPSRPASNRSPLLPERRLSLGPRWSGVTTLRSVKTPSSPHLAGFVAAGPCRQAPAGVRALAGLVEQQAHHDRVPKFTTGPPVLLRPPPFFGEAALAVERDRGRVLREHLQAQLVQSVAASPVDRRLHQGG